MDRKYACITFSLLLLAFLNAPAQDTAAGVNRYHQYLRFFSLVKGAAVKPHWLKDGNSFWYTEGDEQKTLWLVDPVHNTKKQLTATDSLYNAATVFRPSLPADAGAKLFSPDRLKYVFTKDYNIWFADTVTRKTIPLTQDGVQDNSWMIPEKAWSDDGLHLVAGRSDMRRVHRLPVVNYSQPEEEVEWSRYAKTGGAIEKTEWYIINSANRQQVKITVDAADHYLFPAGWRPGGADFIMMRLNRECDTLELLAVDGVSGRSRVILTETQKTFVAGMDFIAGQWVNQLTMLADGNRFIWMSERDGWNHLYLYSWSGQLVRQLTRGNFPVTGVAGVDEKNGWIYVKANAEKQLYYTNLYRVNMKGELFTKLTEGSGPHSIALSPSFRYFTDRYSDASHAPVVELRSCDGKLLRVLQTTDISSLEQTGWRAPEPFVAKADDGVTDIYGIVYRPFDLDTGRKYPLVEFIYAGPVMPIVPAGFFPSSGLSLQAQALAQLGYITVLIDGRGTTGRSKAFQDVIFKNIGRYEIPDHVTAIKQLAGSHAYIDLNRVGVFGHSWGGYFALRAMLTAPDFYKVGIASAPGDLTESPEINEPYMRLPQHNWEGYRYGSNPALASQLKGKLLLVHGTADVNAPLSTTVRMIDALIKAGKPYDLILLPQQTHFYEGKSEEYLNEAVLRYFKAHL